MINTSDWLIATQAIGDRILLKKNLEQNAS